MLTLVIIFDVFGLHLEVKGQGGMSTFMTVLSRLHSRLKLAEILFRSHKRSQRGLWGHVSRRIRMFLLSWLMVNAGIEAG